jgi:two-component system, NtrC family, sensor kinase
MGVILGFAQIVAKNMKEGDPLYMPLKSIEREVIRCKKLVGDLLTFSRTEKTQMEATYINGVIEEILSLIEARTKVKNVEIIRKYGIDLPRITMNKNQIQQVIMNLCNNAIDAMAEAGKLTITTKQTGTQIEIDVADTGKGMPEEVKKHIFEPFYTTKEVGKGTGLGLSLCYEIIQRHKGTIEAESENGKGTVFVVKLPLTQ